jgi:zinc transport system ATP-binding protein
LPASPLIRVEGLAVRYGGPQVLQDVDMEVSEGDFVGIVGPNGSGKTTLVRTIVGLETPDSGRVTLMGQPAGDFDQHDRLGFVPQDAVEVDPHFPASALEVALLGRVGARGLFRPWSSEDRAIALEALETVDVDHLAHRPVADLSGGERQRVFLAKALASRPDLLILDEPTAGVDPAAREEFYNLVDGFNHDRDLTVVLVSHDVQALTLCCHRIVALNRTVVYDGPPEGFEEAGGFSSVHDMRVEHHDGEASS